MYDELTLKLERNRDIGKPRMHPRINVRYRQHYNRRSICTVTAHDVKRTGKALDMVEYCELRSLQLRWPRDAMVQYNPMSAGAHASSANPISDPTEVLTRHNTPQRSTTVSPLRPQHLLTMKGGRGINEVRTMPYDSRYLMVPVPCEHSEHSRRDTDEGKEMCKVS